MKLSLTVAALATLIVIIGISCVDAQYQPECASWDQLIKVITRNVRNIPTASAKCSRSLDCTRFACKFFMLGKDLIFDIKLYPCTTPAQMRLLVLSQTDNVYFEQIVMHRDTYPIPGLTYTLFPGMRLQISVQVHFKKMPHGIEVGLRLKCTGPTPLISFSYPIFPDYVISTGPCQPSVTPSQLHCTEMNKTVTAMTPPPVYQCEMVPSCQGFQCDGTIGIRAPERSFNINFSLTMNGCDSPLSYAITLNTPGDHWQYKFFRSKVVPVDIPLPRQTALYVNLTMDPTLDLESMITSLALSYCVGRMACKLDVILSNTLVPIPPCIAVGPTNPTPTDGAVTTPQPDGCTVWRNVEESLIKSAGPGYGITSCSTIQSCSGYNCTGEFEGHNYTILTVLEHCTDPVMLRMKVESISDNFYWERNVTHNDNISVDGTSGMLAFHVHLLKLSTKQVLVGVYAMVGLPGLSPLSVPLIQDQVMPVSLCQGRGNPGGTNPQGPRGPGNNRPPGPRPTKRPVQNMKMRTGASVGIGLTIGVGIAALVATIMIYIYYRRMPNHQDQLILVHETLPSDSHLNTSRLQAVSNPNILLQSSRSHAQ